MSKHVLQIIKKDEQNEKMKYIKFFVGYQDDDYDDYDYDDDNYDDENNG
jgi:hypothetical protein